MTATVAWISMTPVKGLRLLHPEEVELTEDGVPGDRAFFLVGEDAKMVSVKRLGPLLSVVPSYDLDAGTLSLLFPDGQEVAGAIELGAPEPVTFYGLRLKSRPVNGAFSAALSEHCGTPVRMVAAPANRRGMDRGREGAVTLLSFASLERLREVAGETDDIDPRRFRMTLGVQGLEPHEEDEWIGKELRVGEAGLRVSGNVGRCAVTTRDPDTGVVDFKTLHHLEAYRGGVETTEPLPFGVHARVVQPGRVRAGDPVGPA